MERELHAPGMGDNKNSTQIMSLSVGTFLIVIGLAGILFEGFAGLHLSAIYSTVITVTGALLFYNGYKNNSGDAFLCCLIFALFYGLNAIVGWTLGFPGIPRVGFDDLDPNWIIIIPRILEHGKNDHILNTVLAVVLFGGALDWWRRYINKGNRTETLKDIRNDYKNRYSAHTDRSLRH